MSANVALGVLLFLALLVVVDRGVGMRRAERAADVAVRQVQGLTCRVHLAEQTLRAIDDKLYDVACRLDDTTAERAGVYDHEDEVGS